MKKLRYIYTLAVACEVNIPDGADPQKILEQIQADNTIDGVPIGGPTEQHAEWFLVDVATNSDVVAEIITDWTPIS